ncbi:MAG: HAMP domain-containing histidine kinase [Bacteriovoracaceae bacterium]|nr:HAMP domain-containing histidine kinase [Bacteriovoracaceae bacterium]
MREKITRMVNSKKGPAGLLLLACLLGAVVIISQNSWKIEKTSILTDGVGTCFSRVVQTHTAYLLGGGASVYMSKGFTDGTEECFAEAVCNLEENLGKTMADVSRELNSLASSVHWFHEKLSSGDNKLLSEVDFRSRLGIRFSKIEVMRDQVVMKLDEYREKLSGKLISTSYVLYALMFLVPLLFIFEFVGNEIKRRKNRILDARALDELGRDDVALMGNVERIISEALHKNDLVNCSKLFSSFHSDVLSGKINSFITRPYIEKTVFEVPERGIIPTPDVEITETSVQEQATINVNIDEVLTRIIDSMAGRLFTRGIILDLRIEDNIWVRGTKDGVEQIFFQLLSYLIGLVPDNESTRKVIVRSKKCADSIVVEFVDTAVVFPKEVLEADAGDIDCSLAIGLEFLREYGGDMGLSNIDGATIRFTLKPGTREKTLVNLKKGSKKDILRDFAVQNNN